MALRLFLFLFPLFFLNIVSATNELDSLKQQYYKASTSDERYQIAYEIAKKLISSEPDSAMKYISDAVKDSAQNRQSNYLANCLNAYAVHYIYTGQYDSCLHFASRALKIFLLNMDTASSITPRKNIAIASQRLGDYQLATNAFFKIIEYHKSRNEAIKTAATLNDLGNTYIYIEDYELAIKYQKEALSYLSVEKNDKIEGSIYTSLGFIYSRKEIKDSAYYYYEKSLTQALKSGNVYSIMIARNNLCGEIDYQKEPKKCNECYLQLLKDQRRNNNVSGIARTYLNLSLNYRKSSKYKQALQSLDSGSYYLSLSNDIYLQKKYFQIYSATYYEFDEFEIAYQYLDSLGTLKDSIFLLEKQEEILELDTKYQTKQKIESIKTLETENELISLQVKNQYLQIVFLIFFVITLISGGAIFYFFLKQRQKKQRELALMKMREAERVRIAHDMHDEIGSGLTRISLLSEQMKLQTQIDKKSNIGNISKIIDQSRSLSGSLKEIIWAIDPANDNLSELLFYLRDYIYEFSSNSNLECNIDFPDMETEFEVNSDIRRNIFLIIKEALNNTAKYAEAESVSVKFQMENNLASIVVKDNGKGFNKELVSKGVGLISMQARVEKLGGSIQIDSIIDKGTQINIKDVILITTNM